MVKLRLHSFGSDRHRLLPVESPEWRVLVLALGWALGVPVQFGVNNLLSGSLTQNNVISICLDNCYNKAVNQRAALLSRSKVLQRMGNLFFTPWDTGCVLANQQWPEF